MPLSYEDQIGIGANVNSAIQQALDRHLGTYDPGLIAAIAQALLVQLDQAGYCIERK